jgi:hypothetical protein
VIFLLLAPLIVTFWVSAAWSADVSPAPAPPLESHPDNPQKHNTPPPSRIDPGIERRPQTVPDNRSTISPPNIDPKIAIDPETSTPAIEKPKPGGSIEPPSEPSTR